MTEEEVFERLRKKLQAIELTPSFKTLSTGVLAFDYILGGGLPEGRLAEIYGDWSSGKSALVYHAIVQAQREGGVAMLHDSEGALSVPWAETLGIDMERLLYYEPMPIESVFDKMEEGIKAVMADEYFRLKPFLLVWDSVAATMAKEELKREYGDAEVALRARVISGALRKLTGLIRNSKTIVVFTNQLRDRPMVMFGDTEETTGGRAIKFHSSLRCEMQKKFGKSGLILSPSGTQVIGVKCSIKCTKSKVCVPFRYVDFDLYYDGGIPRMSGLLDLMVREGKIAHTPKTAWYSLGERRFRADEFTEEIYREALLRAQSRDTILTTEEGASEDLHVEETEGPSREVDEGDDQTSKG